MKLFSMKSETDDGISSCSNFPERPSSYALESNKRVLLEIEHLRGKMGEGEFELLRVVLNQNADVFSKHKADIGGCNFVEHEIELEEGAVPHREGVKRLKGGQLRFCCDFRNLHAVTLKDAYPIPRIDESLSKLGDANFFTRLDLGSAFWQVPLQKKDRGKIAIACELGL